MDIKKIFSCASKNFKFRFLVKIDLLTNICCNTTNMFNWIRETPLTYKDQQISGNDKIIFAIKCFIIGSNNLVIGNNNTIIGFKNINIQLNCNEDNIKIINDDCENVFINKQYEKPTLTFEDSLFDKVSCDTSQGVCSICLIHIANCVITPCFHKIICITCSLKLTTTNHKHCPKCRTLIHNINRIFE